MRDYRHEVGADLDNIDERFKRGMTNLSDRIDQNKQTAIAALRAASRDHTPKRQPSPRSILVTLP